MTTAHIPKTHAKNLQKYLRIFFGFCSDRIVLLLLRKLYIDTEAKKKPPSCRSLGHNPRRKFLTEETLQFFFPLFASFRCRGTVLLPGGFLRRNFSISSLDCGFQQDKRRTKPTRNGMKIISLAKLRATQKNREYQAMDTIKLHIAYFWWIHMCWNGSSAQERMRFLCKHFAKNTNRIVLVEWKYSSTFVISGEWPHETIFSLEIDINGDGLCLDNFNFIMSSSCSGLEKSSFSKMPCIIQIDA